MISLPNNCRCSTPNITPKNWKTGGKSLLNRKWFISYRFYDPNQTNNPRYGKPIITKGGINSFATIEERRVATQIAYDDLMRNLKNGFNPLAKSTIIPIGEVSNITALSPFDKALLYCQAQLKAHADTTIRDIEETVERVNAESKKQNLNYLAINSIKRKHVIQVLNKLAIKKDGEYSPYQFNKYRTYLIMLFNVLVDEEIFDTNPITQIKKAKTTKRIRKTLTADERKKVDEYLRENYPRFWLFVHIFYHSGARESEMVRVKGSDVELVKQRVKYLIKKGKTYREEYRTIKDIAVPFWLEAMKGCKANQYVFGRGLMPADTPIKSYQIEKRWRRLVKTRLGIEADFYSIKHMHTTEVAELLDSAKAAEHNKHSVSMVENIYDVNQKTRKANTVKTLPNTFS